MLYTSDHGENVFDDDRKLFLHASPTPSYYELHVPLIAWVSESYDRLYPGIHATLVANRHKPVASSASFFHSMLGLAGISTPYRADSLNISSGKLHSAPRRYLNDHNKAMPLDKTGLSEKDLEMIGNVGKKH